MSLERMAAHFSERTDVGSDYENPLGKNLANGHRVNASEQETPFLQLHPMMGDHRANGDKWKLSTIGLSILVVMLIAINVHLWAKQHQVPTAPSPPDASSPSLDASSCPQGWVRNEGRCYFFLDTEETWNASRIACSSLGGSLVAMDTPQKWRFLLGPGHPIYFWLGLRREGVGESWKLADGSLSNHTFRIASEGLCAYMNNRNPSSTWCDKKRHWICTKPIRKIGQNLS